MKFKAITLLIFLFTGLSLSSESIDLNILYPQIKHTKWTIVQCPGDNATNRNILDQFITHSEWSVERQITGTTNLSISQIVLLNDNNYQNICNSFNSILQETISKTINSDRVYNLTYYKVSNFYFVVISLKKPDDSDSVIFGLSHLIIYDSNLNRIEGYSF